MCTLTLSLSFSDERSHNSISLSTFIDLFNYHCDHDRTFLSPKIFSLWEFFEVTTSLTSDNHWSFSIITFCLFENVLQMESYIMEPFETGFFYSTKFEIYLSCWVYQYFISVYYWIVFHCMATPSLFIH